MFFSKAVCSILFDIILRPIPGLSSLHPLDLFLQLEDTVHQGLSSGRASWDINIDGDDSIAASDDTVGIMVVASTVGAAAHGEHPPWLGHLIIDFSEGWSHLCKKSLSVLTELTIENFVV